MFQKRYHSHVSVLPLPDCLDLILALGDSGQVTVTTVLDAVGCDGVAYMLRLYFVRVVLNFEAFPKAFLTSQIEAQYAKGFDSLYSSGEGAVFFLFYFFHLRIIILSLFVGLVFHTFSIHVLLAYRVEFGHFLPYPRPPLPCRFCPTKATGHCSCVLPTSLPAIALVPSLPYYCGFPY